MEIGIIGYGHIARAVHARALQHIPGVTLSAVAEKDPVRLAQAQEEYPAAQCYLSYEELLASGNVEGVIVALPNALHVQAALSALQNDKHVYLEKPMATQLAEAASVLSEWRTRQVIGMVGFNYRFHPLYQELARRMAASEIGELIVLRTIFHTSSDQIPAWKARRESGGGVLLDLASHHIDLVQMLTGESIISVSAKVRSKKSEADQALVSLELAGGLLVQSSFAFHSFEADRVEVVGSEGVFMVDRHHSLRVETVRESQLFRRGYGLRQGIAASLVSSPYARTKMRAPRYDVSFGRALGAFVNAIQEQRACSPTFWDGYRALAVVLAAEEAAQSGRQVLIDHEDFDA
jgi:myo-inositol 2-dehydrogenase / D-chiro-inositol 1-dehydrogenase